MDFPSAFEVLVPLKNCSLMKVPHGSHTRSWGLLVLMVHALGALGVVYQLPDSPSLTGLSGSSPRTDVLGVLGRTESRDLARVFLLLVPKCFGMRG